MKETKQNTIKNHVIQESGNNSLPFSFEDETNPHLTTHLLTLGHLKIYIRLRYPSYRLAGEDAGISVGRVKQIVNGFFIPKTPELIKQIASGWSLDPVVLTLLFDKYRGDKE